MIVIRCCLLLTICLTPTFAVDVFGGNNETLPAGELPLSDQKDLYQQFFGAADKDARSSSDRLKLAIKLRLACDDQTYKALRRYMITRIDELCEGQKKKEAYEMRIFAFDELNQHKEANRRDNLHMIELLELYIKKADKSDRESIMQEIATIHNHNAKIAVAKKDFEQAVEDYEALASLLKKTKDKDGAAMAKNTVAYIDDYLEHKEETEELLKEGSISADDHYEIAVFYARDHQWSEAHKHIEQAQKLDLFPISAVAAKEEATADEQSQMLVAIGKVLVNRDYRKATHLKRALLELGLASKSKIDQQTEQLSEAMKIKYALVTQDWPGMLEELGPNPLQGFEVAASGSSVDEARLIRMGWEPLFDHQTASWLRPDFKNSPLMNCEVINGIAVFKKKDKQALWADRFKSLKSFKAFKIRFKHNGANAGFWLEFFEGGIGQQKGNAPRLMNRQGTIGLTKGFSSEFGRFTEKEGEWNDFTMHWDGKLVKATLNGEAFKEFPFDGQLENTRMHVFPAGDTELHIQSILALPKDK